MRPSNTVASTGSVLIIPIAACASAASVRARAYVSYGLFACCSLSAKSVLVHVFQVTMWDIMECTVSENASLVLQCLAHTTMDLHWRPSHAPACHIRV